jgi:hypothetical protein
VQSNPRDSILLYKEEIPPQELQQHIPEPSGSTLISFSDFASLQTPISLLVNLLCLLGIYIIELTYCQAGLSCFRRRLPPLQAMGSSLLKELSLFSPLSGLQQFAPLVADCHGWRCFDLGEEADHFHKSGVISMEHFAAIRSGKGLHFSNSLLCSALLILGKTAIVHPHSSDRHEARAKVTVSVFR